MTNDHSIMKNRTLLLTAFTLLLHSFQLFAQTAGRQVSNFNKGWLFSLEDSAIANLPDASNKHWRTLNLPHDWSIEGPFSEKNPAGFDGGALPGGIGWYCKAFTLPATAQNKRVFIAFDGVYRCSDVWINGHHLGYRPNGYISFQYELTPYLKSGSAQNIIAVRVDNSLQQNSRWYSGSGIYRNVWLITTNNIAVDQWGTYVTTPQVSEQAATVNVQVSIANAAQQAQPIKIQNSIYNEAGKQVAQQVTEQVALTGEKQVVQQQLTVYKPELWSDTHPYLYKVITQLWQGGKLLDQYTTPLGIRYFEFTTDNGFLLNGKRVKIRGVCDHHDLGCLGAAINTRALERQLQMLKDMGCNGIRTSHNPPAPELLDLCDKMGFIVMDEAFDMWKKPKTTYDYHLYWDNWHARDLRDQLLRDRNHPSVFLWSIGNEIPEQHDTINGGRIALELAAIVKSIDTTRPITAANNNPDTRNVIIRSGALDVIGYNYHNNELKNFHERYPGKKFIGTETTSALETRGVYTQPTDSIKRWPSEHKVNGKKVPVPMNSDLTCPAYDYVSTPWGNTHEEVWKVYKKYDFLSGFYIWTGFDYLGEPTPYEWPARSSYFGIIDLAGFPKDVYYMYQSEWTSKPVLHILPHWNWHAGDTVDVWAYYNQADEVELYLNGKSLGARSKTGDSLHVWWRVKYEPGTLEAVSRKNGKKVLTQVVKTAGAPARIQLVADRSKIKAGGDDLSFITVKITDKNGNLVPDADNLVHFSVNGHAAIAGVDNGSETSLESFKAPQRQAYKGLALVVLQGTASAGTATLTATADGLQSASLAVTVE